MFSVFTSLKEYASSWVMLMVAALEITNTSNVVERARKRILNIDLEESVLKEGMLTIVMCANVGYLRLLQ